MIALFMILLGGTFFIGIGLGCWFRWDQFRAVHDTLANTEDELQAARDSQQFWFREYQILVSSLHKLKHCDPGDEWKYGSYD